MKRDAALEHKQPKFLSTAAISREAACKEQEQSTVLCCAVQGLLQLSARAMQQCNVASWVPHPQVLSQPWLAAALCQQ